MRRRLFLLIGSLLTVSLMPGSFWAQPRPLRGSANIPKLFEGSDLVCRGTVSGFRVTDEQTETRQGQPIIRRSVLVDIRLERIYKGPALASVTLRDVVDETPGWGSLPQLYASGQYLLLFLKQAGPEYVYAHQYFGRFSPSAMLSQDSVSGAQLLEADLEAGLRDANRERATTNLELLLGYPRLRSTAEIADLLKLGDPQISCFVFAILVKNHDFSHASEMLAFADQLPNTGPISFDAAPLIAAVSMLQSTPAQWPLLVAFSRSKSLYIRRAAVQALRAQHSEKAVAVMVEHLDDADSEVRLQALKALAEITGQQDPEHSPSVPEFEQGEGKYIQLGKNWWQQVGRFQYPAPEGK